MRILASTLLCAAALATFPAVAGAQENFEIQVYGSELIPKKVTIFELHTNFTGSGRKVVEDGLLPTEHAVHETLEVTRGFSDWFEVGSYLFLSARPGDGFKFVGTHVRPRVSVPERLHWPVGLSLSQEIGYQTREFSEATWSYELRPIIDQQLGRFYWSFNPTLERGLNNDTGGFEFAPNALVSYDLTSKVTAALEYYGGFGPVAHLQSWSEGGQQIFPAINIDFGPQWEFNAGLGFGLTDSADPFIVKVIVGRRFGKLPPAR